MNIENAATCFQNIKNNLEECTAYLEVDILVGFHTPMSNFGRDAHSYLGARDIRVLSFGLAIYGNIRIIHDIVRHGH